MLRTEAWDPRAHHRTPDPGPRSFFSGPRPFPSGPQSPVRGSRSFPSGPRTPASGFTLAGMMVVLAIMAILLTVAAQTASFQKRRENEEELIFRGNQTIEAIRIFRARNGRFPVALEELEKAKPRVERKKWVDPVTGKFDWVPVFVGQGGPPVPLPGQQPGPTPTPKPEGEGEGEGGTPPAFPPTDARGPIIGVHSRSCDESIKVLEGRSRYCDWKFVFDPTKLARQKIFGPGGGVPPPTPHP